jgi:two-component system nitrate/nitrite response regulator NarL
MLRSESVQTLVVASSGLVRAGLAATLRQTRFTVVSNSGSFDAAEALTGEQGSKRLLIAVVEDANTASMLSEIVTVHNDLMVVGLVNDRDARLLSHQIAERTAAILDASVCSEVLLSALDLVLAGLRLQSNGIVQGLESSDARASEPSVANELHFRSDEKPLHNLSPREIEVLRGLSVGESNKIIARSFDLAEATVKIHVKNVLRKLKAQNRTQAAIWARENGICGRAVTGQHSSMIAP